MEANTLVGNWNDSGSISISSDKFSPLPQKKLVQMSIRSIGAMKPDELNYRE